MTTPLMTRRHFNVSLAGLAAAGALAGTTRGAAAESLINFQSTWLNDPEFIGYMLAIDKGYYAAEGLKVNYIPGGPNLIPEGSLLSGKGAHADFDAAIKNLPVALRGKRPKGAQHSPWELLEHMRIAQWDILEFSRDGKHVSPKWPEGYWPPKPAPPNDQAWSKSVKAFRADLQSMIDLVSDEATDLYAKIPHGDGQTILREALLVADHNSYHLGAMIVVRRLLGAWK